MTGYQKYPKAIKNNNPMSEAQWREAIGLKDEEAQHIPLQIRPKNQRKVDATHKNYEAIK